MAIATTALTAALLIVAFDRPFSQAPASVNPPVAGLPTSVPRLAPSPTSSPTPPPTPFPTPQTIQTLEATASPSAADVRFASLTFSGLYSERIDTDIARSECLLGHDLGSTRTYVKSVTVYANELSIENWFFDLRQDGGFQSADMVFFSTSGYFGWFNEPNDHSITNVSPSLVKIDIELGGGDIRVRGTISCPHE